jgi:hypothetical protein
MNPLLETWVSSGPDHDDLQNPYWTIEQAGCPGRHNDPERFETHGDPCVITTVQREMQHGCDEGLSYDDLEKRAAILAAAPRMLRILLEAEVVFRPKKLDVLLTELGFPDKASREAARQLIDRLP